MWSDASEEDARQARSTQWLLQGRLRGSRAWCAWGEWVGAPAAVQEGTAAGKGALGGHAGTWACKGQLALSKEMTLHCGWALSSQGKAFRARGHPSRGLGSLGPSFQLHNHWPQSLANF